MRTASLAAIVTLVVASVARAQVPAHAIGIGVSLNPSAFVLSSSQTTTILPVGFGDVFVPIIAGSLKIEPEFGIWRTSSSYSGTSYSGSSTGTLLRAGVGMFRLVRAGGGTALYLGPRVVMMRSSTSATSSGSGSSSSHQTDWSFGLAIGGEHFFSPHFSFGGEVQLNYVTIGNEVDSQNPNPGPSPSNSMITNNGLIFIRLYR